MLLETRGMKIASSARDVNDLGFYQLPRIGKGRHHTLTFLLVMKLLVERNRFDFDTAWDFLSKDYIKLRRMRSSQFLKLEVKSKLNKQFPQSNYTILAASEAQELMRKKYVEDIGIARYSPKIANNLSRTDSTSEDENLNLLTDKYLMLRINIIHSSLIL